MPRVESATNDKPCLFTNEYGGMSSKTTTLNSFKRQASGATAGAMIYNQKLYGINDGKKDRVFVPVLNGKQLNKGKNL
jgi:hypothetical protein